MKGPNELRPWTEQDEADLKEAEAMIERHLQDDGETTITFSDCKMEVVDRAAASARKAGWRVRQSHFTLTVSRS
jgi:hypothetical protein